MNTSTTNIIANNLTSTYPGIILVLGIILGCIFAFVFRKEVSAKVRELIAIRTGKNSGLDFGNNRNDDTVTSPQIEELKEEQKELEPKNESLEDPGKTPETPDDWRRELLFRSIMGEKELAEAAFKALQKLTNGDEQKIDEINYLGYKVRFLKDVSALEQLNKFTLEESNSTKVIEKSYESIGQSYLYLSRFPESRSAFEKALEKSNLETDRSKYITQIAKSMWENGDKEPAFDLLEDTLAQVEEKQSKIKLYQCIAELKDKEKNYEEKALSIEKIISLGDLSSDNFFNAGYAYSECGFDNMAFWHYINAKKIGGGSTTLNNLGVEYERLGLPVKSVESYRDSFSKNETLAAANMAKKLLSVGFLDEARIILEGALTKENVHEDVNAVLSSIKEKQTIEDEREQYLIKKAQDIQKFMLKFTENYFEKKTRKEITANYYEKKGASVNVLIEDNKIICIWEQENLSGTKKKYKLEGKLHNNAARIVIYKEDSWNTYISKKQIMERELDGYLYVGDDGLLNILSYSDKNKNDSNIFIFTEKK